MRETMNVRNYLTVTVHRVDESGHEAGTETLDAFSVEVGAVGQLIIQGTGDISVTFAPTTWGRYQVKRIPGLRLADGGFVGNG